MATILSCTIFYSAHPTYDIFYWIDFLLPSVEGKDYDAKYLFACFQWFQNSSSKDRCRGGMHSRTVPRSVLPGHWAPERPAGRAGAAGTADGRTPAMETQPLKPHPPARMPSHEGGTDYDIIITNKHRIIFNQKTPLKKNCCFPLDHPFSLQGPAEVLQGIGCGLWPTSVPRVQGNLPASAWKPRKRLPPAIHRKLEELRRPAPAE